MELNCRKHNRLTDYNYSSNGIYFVTLCVKNKEPILSQIVGRGDLDAPEVLLSDYGRIVAENIKRMNELYTNISTEKFIIMPNHIHLLIRIHYSEKGASGSPLPTNSLLSRYIGAFKRHYNKEIGYNIWQNSFYDHVIRDKNDYIDHIKYIENNPAKWLLGKDRYSNTSS